MNAVIIYSTFIIWLLYYLLLCKNALKEISFDKDTKYLKWLKKNFYNVFKIMTLLLIILFIYFMKFNNELVNKILFFTINLYLYIDLIYVDANTKKKLKKNKSNKIIFAFLLISASIPFLYYFLTQNLAITYLFLLLYSYFSYFLVLIMQITEKRFTKYLKKNKKIIKKNSKLR